MARVSNIFPALKKRAAQIKVLLMDVDGTMFESEDANPIKTGLPVDARTSGGGSWNNEHKGTLAGYPTIAVFEEDQFHPSITVRPILCVVWRIQVQERTCFREDSALEGAAVNGRNSLLVGGRSSVRVELDACQVGVSILHDLK